MPKILGEHTRSLGLFNVIWFTCLYYNNIKTLDMRTEGTFKVFVIFQAILLFLILISVFVKTSKFHLKVWIVLIRYIALTCTTINGVLQVYYIHGPVLHLRLQVAVLIIILLVCLWIISRYRDERTTYWLYEYTGKYF